MKFPIGSYVICNGAPQQTVWQVVPGRSSMPPWNRQIQLAFERTYQPFALRVDWTMTIWEGSLEEVPPLVLLAVASSEEFRDAPN